LIKGVIVLRIENGIPNQHSQEEQEKKSEWLITHARDSISRYVWDLDGIESLEMYIFFMSRYIREYDGIKTLKEKRE
jgi:hypothetical protein